MGEGVLSPSPVTPMHKSAKVKSQEIKRGQRVFEFIIGTQIKMSGKLFIDYLGPSVFNISPLRMNKILFNNVN